MEFSTFSGLPQTHEHTGVFSSYLFVNGRFLRDLRCHSQSTHIITGFRFAGTRALAQKIPPPDVCRDKNRIEVLQGAPSLGGPIKELPKGAGIVGSDVEASNIGGEELDEALGRLLAFSCNYRRKRKVVLENVRLLSRSLFRPKVRRSELQTLPQTLPPPPTRLEDRPIYTSSRLKIWWIV